jgi:hypothetical protein
MYAGREGHVLIKDEKGHWHWTDTLEMRSARRVVIGVVSGLLLVSTVLLTWGLT